MLCEIKIENVAVIEKAAAVFSDGLNVLSGETGAGKSILIDSINAILGNRTSREIVRSHTPKAMIWATFRGIGAKTRAQLADAGYEAENELLLYRQRGKALAASTACRQQRLWCATSAVDLSTFMASTTIRA